ncbi:MAG: helix-turn-helix domain-containing protein [Methanofastidiosum sp.]|jgi:excisionase family DNA binding protein
MNELPLTLTVTDIKNILGINRASAYQLVKRKNFPAFNIGKRIIIPRDKFLEWLNEQVEKNTTF